MNNLKKNENAASGITLIALVITIIVLLILAGASLSAALGDNGIIGRAQIASNEMEVSSIKEALQLYYLGNELSSIIENPVTKKFESGKITDEKTLETILQYQSDAETIEQIHFERLYELDTKKLGISNVKNEYFMDVETRIVYINEGINLSEGRVYVIEAKEIMPVTITASEGEKGFILVATADETDERIKSYSFYINNELYETVETSSRTAEIEVEDKEFGEHECYVKVTRSNGQINNSLVITAESYYIRTLADMNTFKERVNNGNSFSGKTVRIMNAIDLGGSINNRNWTAIGKSGSEFSGILEGNNNKIQNIYNTEITEEYQGLIGAASGATIKNLTIESGDIQGSQYCAGVLGYGTNTNIENCNNFINVLAQKGYTGGIVGMIEGSGSITKCTNTGNISSLENIGNTPLDSFVGGIAGCSYVKISDCDNTGNINSIYSAIGGIAGAMWEDLSDCKNTGTILVTGKNANNDSTVGGITGYIENHTITDSSNTGTVEGDGAGVGGIVGISNSSNVLNSNNIGNIITNLRHAGGIVGLNSGTNTATKKIENCYNIGRVEETGLIVEEEAGSYIGGIVGQGSACTINLCSNSGVILGNGFGIGGIAGESMGQISNSFNKGKITGQGKDSANNTCVGGIAGRILNSYEVETKAENCYNTGDVNGNGNHVGGITGAHHGANIIKCYNTAKITSEAGLVGGITGGNYYIQDENKIYSRIESSYNTGEIKANGSANENNNSIVGGIVGSNRGTIYKCWNSGKITTQYSAVGGIAGDSFKEIIQCYNIGEIETINKDVGNNSMAGGIVGHSAPEDTIDSCYNRGEIKASYDWVGGIVAWYEKGAIIKNSYNTFPITEDLSRGIGPVIGWESHEGDTNITNCYYLGTTSSGEERAEADMKTSAFIELLGGTTIWKLDTEDKNDGFIILEWQQ